jgi:hypothetical protein
VASCKPSRRWLPAACHGLLRRATQSGNDSVLPGDYPRAGRGAGAGVDGALALAAARHLRAGGWTLLGRARSHRPTMKEAA